MLCYYDFLLIVKHIPSTGVSTTMPSGSGGKQSPAMRRIPPTLPSTHLQREPSQFHPHAPSTVTIEVKRGSTERLEFSSDQLSTVVDQFEQFLESEEMEAGKQQVGSEQRLSVSSTKSGDQKEDPKTDPFEFVEEIISKDSESSVPRSNTGQDIPRAAAQDAAVAVIGQRPSIVQQVRLWSSNGSQTARTWMLQK